MKTALEKTQPETDQPEVIQDVAAAIESAILDYGVLTEQEAAELSVLAANAFWERFAGEQIFVRQQLSKKYHEIYERMCSPHACLEAVAHDYGYTTRHIRSICKQMAEAENARLQPGLFE